MSRSLWKGPFIDNYLFTLNEKNIELNRKIKVWSRRSMILPEFLNQNFEIHNGKQFVSLQVTEDMIGHKFGEFASTRKKTLHKKKLKNKTN
jgi:small subunit ribosomal protein S19